MRLLPAALLTTVIACSAFGQSYTISTMAGGGLPVNIAGTTASLGQVRGAAVDSAGNIFFADTDYNVVLRQDAGTGVLTLVAGNGTAGFSGDNGPATSAQLQFPIGIALDSAGNLYISDVGNYRIRKVSNGVITTVAGNGSDLAGYPYYSHWDGENGPATNSTWSWNRCMIAADSGGNLYISATYLDKILKVSNGVITTAAGTWGGFYGDNGPATRAQLAGPEGIAVDSGGNLYIADMGNNRIRKVSNGVITTVVGNGTKGFSGDNGPATSAQLSLRDSTILNNFDNAVIAVDDVGNLYISDVGNYRIRKVSNGVITTVAGDGTPGFGGDNGPATSARLNMPNGIGVDSAGNLYLSDTYNRIRKVSNGLITTVAGDGTCCFGGDNGPATSAQLDAYDGVAVDYAGNVYIADSNNHRIRKVSNGLITTVAGNGTRGFSGDNRRATDVWLNVPTTIAVDSAGNLYIADTGNNRIRKVSNGVITTVVGDGTRGFSGNNGIAVDSSGNLYFTNGDRIDKVSNGVITTVAGNGKVGFSGDNGPATSAQLFTPSGIAFDFADNLYIADYTNLRIRKVSNGAITTVAGNGKRGFSGDNGPATSAQLNAPTSIAVDSAGNIYVADSNNHRIRILTPPSVLPLSSIANGASNLVGPIAPGEIVVLRGAGLGPAQLVLFQVNGSGNIDTQLAETTVSFNGIKASLIYTSATQVAAVVPYAISGDTAQVVATYQGQTVAGFSVPVASSAPGLFTLDSTGSGQAAAVNQDGTINTERHPASVGSVIALYGTGGGQTSPTAVDNKPAQLPFPLPLLPVSATIGGQLAVVKYAGGAPGAVAGLMQINVQVPSGINTGIAVPVVVQVGSATSQTGVTIAVVN